MLGLAACLCAPGPAGAAPASRKADPVVGPLFPSATTTLHFCTASVVDSPKGDLLVTAAHCIDGRGAGMVFAPGFVDGREPFGTWTVTAAYASPAWVTGQDPQADVAFLVVAPRVVGGRTVDIQQVTGGDPLGHTPRAGQRVTVTGYALGSDDAPVVCRAPVRTNDGFPQFDCDGYVAGTSGGPWVATGTRGHPVVGVIGGLHQGGCRNDVSYTAPFGPSVRRLYDRAVSGAAPSTLPLLGPDGCPSGSST